MIIINSISLLLIFMFSLALDAMHLGVVLVIILGLINVVNGTSKIKLFKKQSRNQNQLRKRFRKN